MLFRRDLFSRSSVLSRRLWFSLDRVRQVDSRVAYLVSISLSDASIWSCRSTVAWSAENWLESLVMMRSSIAFRSFSMSASVSGVLSASWLLWLVSMLSLWLFSGDCFIVGWLCFLLVLPMVFLDFHTDLHRLIGVQKHFLDGFKQDFNRPLPVCDLLRHFQNWKSYWCICQPRKHN